MHPFRRTKSPSRLVRKVILGENAFSGQHLTVGHWRALLRRRRGISPEMIYNGRVGALAFQGVMETGLLADNIRRSATGGSCSVQCCGISREMIYNGHV